MMTMHGTDIEAQESAAAEAAAAVESAVVLATVDWPQLMGWQMTRTARKESRRHGRVAKGRQSWVRRRRRQARPLQQAKDAKE
jgi:hypothetical protein